MLVTNDPGAAFTVVGPIAAPLAAHAGMGVVGLATTAMEASNAACADGDCTNEISQAQHSIERAFKSIEFPDSKLDYILKLDSGKANGFKMLGYTTENADQLRSTLVNMAANENVPLIQTGVTQYGTKYNQIYEIAGPNGVFGRLTVAWQVDNGSTVLRFITAIPQPFQR